MTQSEFPHHADVVVAGGGPGGATIARLLAEFGFRVVLLEKRQFPRHQIGELLTPQILPILDFLGIRQQVEAAGFLCMVGHTVCRGSAQPRTSYYSSDHRRHGFQAWRADFDNLLLAHAREAGVQAIEGLPVESVIMESGTHVTVSTCQGKISSTFFIDATGHAGILARQHLRRRDEIHRTLALTGYWRDATGPVGDDFANTLLETYHRGLVWSVPLHNGLRNVTVLIDWQEGSRIRRTHLVDFYHAELRQTSYVCGFLTEAQLSHPPQAFDATWYTARAFAGDQFLLVGDAGLFIDPLSSEGVHKAMSSAITGAIIVNTILKRPTMRPHALQFYNESQQLTYETHYQQSAQYYREEQRWQEQPFWQKRSSRKVQSPESEVRSHEKRKQARIDSSTLDLGPRTPDFSVSQSPAPGPHTVSALRVASGITVELRPVIEGPFVELREVVVAPRYPRGVRMLREVHLPQLLAIIGQQSAVSSIIESYLATPEGNRCPPESVRQALARLYQEGILVSTDATKTG